MRSSKKNPWFVLTFVCVLALLLSGFVYFRSDDTGTARERQNEAELTPKVEQPAQAAPWPDGGAGVPAP